MVVAESRVGWLLYAATCLGFSLLIGAGLYEHAVVWPKFSAAPPVSLTMFEGPHGISPERFWSRFHPVLMLVTIATLLTHWNCGRRRHLLPIVAVYGAAITTTLWYFVPEALAIIAQGVGDTVDPALKARAQRWETLSTVRVAAFVPATLWLYRGLPNR